MFPFNLLTPTKESNKSNHFEPLFFTRPSSHKLQTPKEIRDMVNKMTRCGNCHFVVFENYWGNEINQRKISLCPTCGYKL